MTGPPIVKFFEWDTSEIADPSIARHIEGGHFAFKQRLARGCSTYTGVGTSGTLLFEKMRFNPSDTSSSEIQSKVTAVTIIPGTSGAAIGNMRLYLKDDSGLLASKDIGLDPAFIQFSTSGTWLPNPYFPSGVGQKLTTSIPSLPNVFRQNGDQSLEGQDTLNSSQYIYMRLFAPFGSPLGTYGICGSGRIQIGLIFDYFPV